MRRFRGPFGKNAWENTRPSCDLWSDSVRFRTIPYDSAWFRHLIPQCGAACQQVLGAVAPLPAFFGIPVRGAFYFVRGIVSFKGRTFVFFAFFAFFGQKISKLGRVRRELDVHRGARNKMEVAT